MIDKKRETAATIFRLRSYREQWAEAGEEKPGTECVVSTVGGLAFSSALVSFASKLTPYMLNVSPQQ